MTEEEAAGQVCGVDLPRLGKHGFNCFEALFGEINSRVTPEHPQGRMQISGRQVVHKGIKISGRNLVRRRVSWFCCTGLRRNVGTITAYDDSASREKDPFDFENDEMFDGRNKTNQLVQLRDLFDCHVVEVSTPPPPPRLQHSERETRVMEGGGGRCGKESRGVSETAEQGRDGGRGSVDGGEGEGEEREEKVNTGG